MKYVTVEEMIRIEKAADAAGHSYQEMMEQAGTGLAAAVQETYGDLPEKRITALVGSGNNGGDALVALAKLEEWGWETSGLLLRSRGEEDPLMHRLQQAGGRLLDCQRLEDCREVLQAEISQADVVLDGVLGTGIRLPIRGPLAEVLGYLKAFLQDLDPPPQVVAVDCPSGIDADSGEVDPVCIPADLTVTMAAVKQGLIKFPAFDFLGELLVVEIGLPEDLPELQEIQRQVMGRAEVKALLPDRPRDAHKGTFGTVLIAAGSENYPGAALLSACGAYRIGAGLVTVGVPERIYPALIGGLPEATWVVLDGEDGGISEQAVERLREFLPRADSLLIGPGVGTRAATRAFVKKTLSLPDLPPVVIDADGLRLISAGERWWQQLPEITVLTPHPGEMAALTGQPVDAIQQDRVAIAEEYADLWGRTLVLKGAHTVIASPGQPTRVIPAATAALSRAGTGDVLAGMIAGLLAQGMEAPEASSVGAWIHAQAGRMAADALGSTAAVLSGDVADAVIDVLAWVMD